MMITCEKNVVLLLLRLDSGNNVPLRFQDFEMLKSENQHLLVGILDPSQKKTYTPMTAIGLHGNRSKIYNEILEGSKQLVESYYQEGGYVDKPETYTSEEKRKILDKIKEIGDKLYSLFNRPDNPLKEWLDSTLDVESKMRPSGHPVTIITNDFSVPWSWFYKPVEGRFLCEACSLGIQQLELNPTEDILHSRNNNHECEEGTACYRALLINGSANLRYSGAELEKISEAIENKTSRRSDYSWEAKQVESLSQLNNLVGSYGDDKEMIESFKILHFSGHYSQNDLMINESKINIKRLLEPVIKNCLLVLDGCSSSQDVTGWTDVGGITSRLINHGALGCIATILPVKHDPVIGDIFWSEFYRQLHLPSSSIGQSLVNARIELKNQLMKLGSDDPVWLLYQLIGSPSIKLIEPKTDNDV